MMHAVALHLGLQLYASSSLKEKRSVIKSVKHRLRNRFNVSLAEVGGLDSWKQADLVVLTVASDRASLDSEVNAIFNFLNSDVRFEVVEREVEVL